MTEEIKWKVYERMGTDVYQSEEDLNNQRPMQCAPHVGQKLLVYFPDGNYIWMTVEDDNHGGFYGVSENFISALAWDGKCGAWVSMGLINKRCVEVLQKTTAAKKREEARVKEAAMIFDREGKELFWLSTKDCSQASIPDSQILWHRIWEYRDVIGGVAHTHPWNGIPSPSQTDVTTWRAIELGLGKQLLWPIVSMTEVRYFVYNVLTNEYVGSSCVFGSNPAWLDIIKELRRTSRGQTTEAVRYVQALPAGAYWGS